MRWLGAVILGFVLIVAVYAAWPLYGMYKIGTVVQARNAAGLTELVNFPRLRRSLTEQIIATYLKLTGKASRLGEIGSQLAIGLGASVAEPILVELLNPEALLDLLNTGSVKIDEHHVHGLASFAKPSLYSAWELWLNSEYSGSDFYVSLPPDRPSVQQFRANLKLMNWKWRLVGIDLPEELRLQLAQEVIRREKRQ